MCYKIIIFCIKGAFFYLTHTLSCKLLLFWQLASLHKAFQGLHLHAVGAVVEQERRIERLAVKATFKVQMGRSGSPRLTRQGYHLTCLDMVAHTHQIL